jgi:hypothetical protein
MLNQFPQYSPFQEQPETRMSSDGMDSDSSMRMNPQPVSTLPALFPSIMTPEQYPQAPFSSPNLMQARYAEGGEVHPQDMMMPPQQEQSPQQGLSELAQLIQQQGQGEDSILAHINREEADFLAKKYGYDVNPMTGLPQFGWFKKIKNFVQKTTPLGGKKFIKHEKKMFGYVAPIAGAIVGGIYGGPAGAAAGGALGGAAAGLVNKKGAKGIGKRAIIGGVGGYLGAKAYGLGGAQGAPGAAGSMGNMGGATDLKGYITNAKSNTLANAFQKTLGGGGSSALGSFLGSGGGGGNAVQRLLPTALNALTGGGGAPQGNGQGGGLLGSLLGVGGSGNLIDKGLGLTALLGTVLGREKQPKQTSLAKLAQQLPPQWQSYHQPRPIGAYQREYVPLPAGYSPTTHGAHQFFRDVNPWQYRRGGPVNLAAGGYIEGNDDGHADTREVPLSDGDFIFDATTVANLGNGNNKAGAIKLAHMQQALHRRGLNSHSVNPPRSILAKLSDGEYRMPSTAVTNLGNGDNKVGAKLLKNVVKNVRNHKGVKGFPPKAKSLQQYMQMKHR